MKKISLLVALFSLVLIGSEVSWATDLDEIDVDQNEEQINDQENPSAVIGGGSLYNYGEDTILSTIPDNPCEQSIQCSITCTVTIYDTHILPGNTLAAPRGTKSQSANWVCAAGKTCNGSCDATGDPIIGCKTCTSNPN